jgi:predicted lipoprotein with Yx(FWY)xxD motif
MHRFATPLIALLALLAPACGGSGGAGSTGGGGAHRAGTVSVRQSSLGKILVDASGRTLYLFERDRGAHSACSGACAAAWPPLTVKGQATAGDGTAMGLIGTTRRPDGTREVTYGGHPLYLYAGDSRPGDTNGQAIKQFGADWYALDGGGRKVEKASPGGGGHSGYGY